MTHDNYTSECSEWILRQSFRSIYPICGAKGDLAEAPDSPPVNYDRTSLDKDQYYYKPFGEFIFMDPHGLNDRITYRTTSSVETPRYVTFKQVVKERVGDFCVFTREEDYVCDAIHLIPRSKGDEYIRTVVRYRSACYDSQPPSIPGIDDVENGIFLSMDVHRRFACGALAFLKTPNFAMDATDIPRIVQGYADEGHITLHQFDHHNFEPVVAQRILDQPARGQPQHPAIAFSAGLNVDALFPANLQSAESLPPAIILDFLYGVAAYKQWKSKSIHDVVKDYFEKYYESIPIVPRRRPHDFDDSYPRGSGGYSRRENVLATAMDEVSLVMTYVTGVTPQEVVRRREKRMEEEEMIARAASRSKVTEWIKTVHNV